MLGPRGRKTPRATHQEIQQACSLRASLVLALSTPVDSHFLRSHTHPRGSERRKVRVP
jgi:hypothetical protein